MACLYGRWTCPYRTTADSSTPSLVTNVAVPVTAPVVTTTKKVTLADHLDLKNLPLATTPGGRNFAMKTLHPADSEIKAVRGPGGLVPSLGIAYDSVDTIPFPVGAVSALIMQTPNIAFPASIVFVDGAGAYVDHYLWSNSAIGGKGLLHAPSTTADIFTPFETLPDKLDSFRVLAQSITCDVIAPAVADQGTIVSAQWIDKPFTFNPSYWHSDTAVALPIQIASVCCDVWAYDEAPKASDLLMGTTAYTAKAREGFYQPLKIDSWKYQSADDGVYFVTNPGVQQVSRVNQVSAALSNYPIYFHNFCPPRQTAHPMPRPSGHIVGMTWIEGTAGNPQVSLRIRLRQVSEVRPCLGSVYAPLVEAPLPPDELSYKMVREIAARLKDGYPASFNDWGKLKDTIARIGKTVLKYADPALDVLSAVPGIGNAVSVAKLGSQFMRGMTDIYNSPSRQKQPQGGKIPPPPPVGYDGIYKAPAKKKKRGKRGGKSKLTGK